MPLFSTAAINDLVDQAYAPLKVQLRGDIHPIWAEKNWDSSQTFATVALAARLATHLLKSPSAELFCHLILFGQLCPIDFEAILKDYPSFEARDKLRGVCKRVNDLDAYDQHDVRSKLEAVAADIKHEVRPLPADRLAQCVRMPAGSPENKSRGSILTYDPEVIDVLTNERLSDDEKRAQILRVACILLHELAHALVKWRWQHMINEPFFENSKLAEAGYELEARLFGGVPELAWTRGERLNLTVREYPTRYTLLKRTAARCRDPDSLPSWPREWTMSLELVRNLVDDDYWAEDGRARDATALVPKSLAHNIRQWLSAGKKPPVPVSIVALFRDEMCPV